MNTEIKKRFVLRCIKTALDKHKFINHEEMTVNEFLFVLTSDELLRDIFVNVIIKSSGLIRYGYAYGFWPVQARAMKVVQYDVWCDDETDDFAIEVIAEEEET